MQVELDKMCDWERKKAIYLLGIAENHLGMDCSGYGDLAVNENSGNTYLWLEDYSFCLYLPINCDLRISDIRVCYSDTYDGEESIKDLSEFANVREIERWTERLSKISERKEKRSA